MSRVVDCVYKSQGRRAQNNDEDMMILVLDFVCLIMDLDFICRYNGKLRFKFK